MATTSPCWRMDRCRSLAVWVSYGGMDWCFDHALATFIAQSPSHPPLPTTSSTLLPWTGIDWLRQKELSGLHELIWNQACLLALEQAGRACLCFAVSGLQTGSGKTFTMEGGPGDLAGVSMRTVEALFQLAADRGPDSVFAFKVGGARMVGCLAASLGFVCLVSGSCCRLILAALANEKGVWNDVSSVDPHVRPIEYEGAAQVHPRRTAPALYTSVPVSMCVSLCR